MAISSDFSTSNRYIKYRIIVTENSTDVNKNKSNVNVKVQVWRTNTGYTTYGSGECRCNIDGVVYKQSITPSQKFTHNSYTEVFNKTLDITHNDNGYKTIYVSSVIAMNVVSSDLQGFNVDLTYIPRQANVTSASNFNDEQNPTIQYQNLAGNAVTTLQAAIYNQAGTTAYASYRDISKTGNSYTFNLTTAERNALRNAIPNKNSMYVRFYIKTIIGGNTFYSYKEVTLSIINANPIASTFTYADTNQITTAITNNDQQIIRNNSLLTFTIGAGTALKGASIAEYYVSFNNNTYDCHTGTNNFGTQNISNNTDAILRVIDTRGNVTTKTINVQFLNWELPYALITTERYQNYYSETSLLVDGKYSSLDNKNTLTIKYQYKKVEDENYNALTTLANNTSTTLNLDNLYQWNIRVLLTDKLGTTTYNLTVDRGQPIIFFDRIRKSVGVNCFPISTDGIESDGLQIDDLIYIGSQTLYDSYTKTTGGTDTVLGSYDYGLIDGVFNGINIPSNYEMAFRLTAQISTNGSQTASVGINNIYSNQGNTWSANTYRKIVSTRIFKKTEITLETTLGYSKNGTNLKCVSSANGEAYFWNITIHGYLVKKSTTLTNYLEVYSSNENGNS